MQQKVILRIFMSK